MLNDLAELNQRRWSGQGSASAFASPRFLAFHHNLIRKCFSAGAIQLLRVSAGAQTVGVLYNFVYRGKVYFYQCGFHYTGDRRLSPGRVTLAMAIQYSLDAGLEDLISWPGRRVTRRSYPRACGIWCGRSFGSAA